MHVAWEKKTKKKQSVLCCFEPYLCAFEIFVVPHALGVRQCMDDIELVLVYVVSAKWQIVYMNVFQR